MPELPEVIRTAEELNVSLAGKYFLNFWISDRAKHINVDSYGKRIIFNLYHSSVGHFRMCSFLGLEGHWGWNSELPHTQLKITLGTIGASPRGFKFYKRESRQLCFDDKLYYGFNKVCYTDKEYDKIFESVGYDLIKDADAITSEWWLK